MPRTERDIAIGKIVGPFGIRGEVKLLVLTDFPERFDRGRNVTLVTETDRRVVKVQRSRPHAGGLIAKLEGVETRNDAEALRDAELVIDKSELADLEPGSYYIFDVLGLKVSTDDGRDLGEVTEILQGGANDVYVTSTGVCIPALKDIVTTIDLDKRVMVIKPMPGLLPED
jgi:16S rRNA processing protein RimM